MTVGDDPEPETLPIVSAGEGQHQDGGRRSLAVGPWKPGLTPRST